MTIPNVTFITSSVNNIGERNYRKFESLLHVEEYTPPDRLKAFTVALEKMVRNTEKMRKENFYIRGNNFGEFSLKILIYVFFKTKTWDE